MEALGYEGWVGEGPGTGGRLGPVLRCCHSSWGLHSEQGRHKNTQRVKQLTTNLIISLFDKIRNK